MGGDISGIALHPMDFVAQTGYLHLDYWTHVPPDGWYVDWSKENLIRMFSLIKFLHETPTRLQTWTAARRWVGRDSCLVFFFSDKSDEILARLIWSGLSS